MNAARKTARIAGLLHLVNGVTGFFGIIYVPGRLIVSGNAAATANNILASERLFRLGIVSELICAAEFVFLLWVLYRLLGAVKKTHASADGDPGFGLRSHYVREYAERDRCPDGARISYPYTTNVSWRPWPCCSWICTGTGTLSVGSCAYGSSPSGFSYLDRVSSRASWVSC
jgi:hypothetical protein